MYTIGTFHDMSPTSSDSAALHSGTPTFSMFFF
jgi:hypothetical protein